MAPAPFGSLNDCVQVFDSTGEVGDQRVGGIGAIAVRERANHEAMLLLHRVEQAHEGGERFWKAQQPQRVTGRRGVDDDASVGIGARPAEDVAKARTAKISSAPGNAASTRP